MGYKEIEGGEIRELDKDESVEAIYTGTQAGEAGRSALHNFEELNGEPFKLWGSAILDDRLSQVAEDTRVRVTYGGMGKSKTGNDLHLWKVEEWENDNENDGE